MLNKKHFANGCYENRAATRNQIARENISQQDENYIPFIIKEDVKLLNHLGNFCNSIFV